MLHQLIGREAEDHRYMQDFLPAYSLSKEDECGEGMKSSVQSFI